MTFKKFSHRHISLSIFLIDIPHPISLRRSLNIILNPDNYVLDENGVSRMN